MASKTFEQVLKESKVQTAYANRQEAFNNLTLSATKLNKLKDQPTIKVSTFLRLESEIEVKIKRLGSCKLLFIEL